MICVIATILVVLVVAKVECFNHAQRVWSRPTLIKLFADSGLWNDLVERLQGDFDNYNQVLIDKEELNGCHVHEHMHACFVPLDNEKKDRGHNVKLIAAYYLNGNPNQVFRLRLYKLVRPTEANQEGILMKLYIPSSAVMQALKPIMDKPQLWSDRLAEMDEIFEEQFCYLEDCNVLWTREMDTVRHAYALNEDNLKEAIHAVLIKEEGAILESSIQPGRLIRVQDELTLWPNELWINDRGTDVETGEAIYGNGVPYKVKRVTKWENNVRKVVDNELSWTI